MKRMPFLSKAFSRTLIVAAHAPLLALLGSASASAGDLDETTWVPPAVRGDKGVGSPAKPVSEPAYSKKSMSDAKGKTLQVVEFGEAQIEGKAKAPDGFVLQSRGSAQFRNIIELRRHFRAQVQTSTADAMLMNAMAP